jgi:hypothetical protein
MIAVVAHTWPDHSSHRIVSLSPARAALRTPTGGPRTETAACRAGAVSRGSTRRSGPSCVRRSAGRPMPGWSFRPGCRHGQLVAADDVAGQLDGAVPTTRARTSAWRSVEKGMTRSRLAARQEGRARRRRRRHSVAGGGPTVPAPATPAGAGAEHVAGPPATILIGRPLAARPAGGRTRGPVGFAGSLIVRRPNVRRAHGSHQAMIQRRCPVISSLISRTEAAMGRKMVVMRELADEWESS